VAQGPAPTLGQHGRAILADLGFTADMVAHFAEEGALIA
jgi:crotonobetainyl-CoA:carnitine CoA-transferase CaiB-like acyl-CoA transferase